MQVKSHFILYSSFTCKMGLYFSVSLSNLKCFRIDKFMQNPDGQNYFTNLENDFMFFFFEFYLVDHDLSKVGG